MKRKQNRRTQCVFHYRSAPAIHSSFYGIVPEKNAFGIPSRFLSHSQMFSLPLKKGGERLLKLQGLVFGGRCVKDSSPNSLNVTLRFSFKWPVCVCVCSRSGNKWNAARPAPRLSYRVQRLLFETIHNYRRARGALLYPCLFGSIIWSIVNTLLYSFRVWLTARPSQSLVVLENNGYSISVVKPVEYFVQRIEASRSMDYLENELVAVFQAVSAPRETIKDM